MGDDGINDYKTIKKYATDQFIEKKSKFIGYIAPISSEEEAIAFINEKKALHWNATHNVHAYSLRNPQIKRYSDDGEPQGTAGIPVLDVLQKEGIHNAVIVVTRYFGGVMLGAGGLVRAYSHCAKLALDASEMITMSVCVSFTIQFHYSVYGKLNSILPNYPILIQDALFEELITIHALIKDSYLDAFINKVTQLTSGSVEITQHDIVFSYIPT